MRREPPAAYEFFEPGGAPIGGAASSGGGSFSLYAIGPQPKDLRKAPLRASWTFYGGTLEHAKVDVENTLRDFGWTMIMITAADAPAQAPH